MNKQMTEQEMLDEAIRLLQAAKEGKVIECRERGVPEPFWTETSCRDSWGIRAFAFDDYEYRIKPEPRRWWVNVYPNGVRTAHETRELAAAAGGGHVECVEVVEVVQ